jgi:hypothetical protein
MAEQETGDSQVRFSHVSGTLPGGTAPLARDRSSGEETWNSNDPLHSRNHYLAHYGLTRKKTSKCVVLHG